MFIPTLVVVTGAVWLLKNLGVIPVSIWVIILPVAVILVGLSMFSKKSCICCGHKDQLK